MQVPNSTVVTALSSAEQIKGRIEELKDAMQKQLPNYESHLMMIHRALQNDRETVQMLTEQEIGVICAALSKKTGMRIAEQESAKLQKKAAKGGKITLADL